MFGYIFHLRPPLVIGGQRHEKKRKGGGELGPDEDVFDENLKKMSEELSKGKYEEWG